MANHEDTETSTDLLAAALQDRAARIRRAAIERTRHSLRGLAPEQGQAVEELLSAIVDRLLDAPLTAIGQLAREGRTESCAPVVRSVLGLS